MRNYQLDFDYDVVERDGGLDVYYKNGDYACELKGKSLDDFSYDDIVDEDALVGAIDEQLDFDENF